MLSPKQIAEIINTTENMERIERDRMRYEIYNGKLKQYIQDAIFREFQLPETVRQMIKRIIPLNLVQKIVRKLAMVYKSPPSRSPVMELPSDTEFLALYEKQSGINSYFKLLNRYFKLQKHSAVESYLNEQGIPSLRTLSSHEFTPISSSTIDPHKAEYIVKHIRWGQNKKEQIHIVWSDFEHYTMDGNGGIIDAGEDGQNPYMVNPIIHITESLDRLIPIEDDDLVSMQIAICLLLTDLSLGMKYRLWGLIYISGAKGTKFSFNPNSVLYLPKDAQGNNPTVGTIRAEFNAQEALQMVEALVGMLLTTKSLKPGSVTGQLNTTNASSGIAKMLDEAEVTEDKQDQVAYFAKAESQLFNEVLKNQMYVWGEAGLLAEEWRAQRISDDFELQIKYPDMKPMQTEKELIETEKLKLESGFTTERRAIMASNPELTTEEAEQLIIEIEKEKKLGVSSDLDQDAQNQLQIDATLETKSAGTKLDITVNKQTDFNAKAILRDKNGDVIDVRNWKFNSDLFEVKVSDTPGEIELYLPQEKVATLKTNGQYKIQATNSMKQKVNVIYGKVFL